jgi:peptidoglycan/LPS O-acetylase OafA/YrhL
LAIVILVSYVSYRFLEEPGMRLGRSLIRKKVASRYQADSGSETEVKIA